MDKTTSSHLASSGTQKGRDMEKGFVGTRNKKMLVDHVGDLSSSSESIVFVSF